MRCLIPGSLAATFLVACEVGVACPVGFHLDEGQVCRGPDAGAEAGGETGKSGVAERTPQAPTGSSVDAGPKKNEASGDLDAGGAFSGDAGDYGEPRSVRDDAAAPSTMSPAASSRVDVPAAPPADAPKDAPENAPVVASTPSCVASTELCDGVDNDCDGMVDEGVRNACGGCDALLLHPKISITASQPLQHRASCSAGGRNGKLLCLTPAILYCRVGVEVCTNGVDDDADGYLDECEEMHSRDVRIQDGYPAELD